MLQQRKVLFGPAPVGYAELLCPVTPRGAGGHDVLQKAEPAWVVMRQHQFDRLGEAAGVLIIVLQPRERVILAVAQASGTVAAFFWRGNAQVSGVVPLPGMEDLDGQRHGCVEMSNKLLRSLRRDALMSNKLLTSAFSLTPRSSRWHSPAAPRR